MKREQKRTYFRTGEWFGKEKSERSRKMVKFNTLALVLFVSVLLAGSVSEGAYVLYDDFSSGNLNKWDTTNSSAASVVNQELDWPQDAAWDDDRILSNSSWDGSFASMANPLGVKVDLSALTFSSESGKKNILMIGFVTSSGTNVFYGDWMFTINGSNERARTFDGTDLSSASWAVWFQPADKMILEYDGTNVTLKRDRNGTITTCSTTIANYSGSLTDLHVMLGFQGANDDGKVVLDNVSVVPEPTTMALLGFGGVVMLVRRRRRS